MNQQESEELSDVEKQQGKLIEELSGIPILGTFPYLEDISLEGIQENLPQIQQAFKNGNFF